MATKPKPVEPDVEVVVEPDAPRPVTTTVYGAPRVED
jgi:hypothetical protein